MSRAVLVSTMDVMASTVMVMRVVAKTGSDDDDGGTDDDDDDDGGGGDEDDDGYDEVDTSAGDNHK